MRYWIVRVETWATVEECDDDPMTDCPGQRAYTMKAEAVAAAKRINEAQQAYRKLVEENYTPSHLPSHQVAAEQQCNECERSNLCVAEPGRCKFARAKKELIEG